MKRIHFYLRRALQALIKSDIPIKEVKFDKNTFEGITQDGRSGIFDLACTDENENHFIVEMQYGDAPSFIQRMKFYALIDHQMTFVTVELDKFTLQELDCQTDLQKLIYTMRTLHTFTQPTQFPKFWD